MTTRAEIVAIARTFLDTPYHHMGRQPGVAMDCAGVLICAGRAAGLVPADFDVPNYVPQSDGVSLLTWCREHLGPAVSRLDLQPGDVIVVRPGVRPQHLALLGDYRHGGLSIIHSSNEARPPRVIETRLMFSEALRFVAAFRMPGVV